MPRVRVRRKERDFGFPSATTHYLIHDSDTFPLFEEGVTAHELPGLQGTAEGVRWSERAWTVVRADADGSTETLRHTVRTLMRPDHTVVRREVELLDAGAHTEDGLQPGRTYYYQLDVVSDPPAFWRATATPAGVHRYHRVLYDALPSVYRRHDTVERPEDATTDFLPEAQGTGGQLRRLVDVFASAVGALRSSADGLATLRDVDQTDARFLPLLAGWIGWHLTGDDVARQRQEIQAAPTRYRTVGTVPGVTTMVEHYTGWSVRVAEPAQNISLTNTPPQRNVFGVVEHDTDVWAAPEDAAEVLGLVGASGREVTGTRKEPFALSDGMTLSLAVDAAEPVRVTIAATEFADVAAAEAREVAGAIERAVPGVQATVTGGKVRLRSASDTDTARIALMPSPASLVTLDGAPYGRVATAAGPDGTQWISYATTTGAGGAPSLRAKARLLGHWYDAQPIGDDTEPQADPALVVRGEQLWCAWVSDPFSGRSRLRYRIGAVPQRTAAALVGDQVGPFALTPDSVLVVQTSMGDQTFTVRPGDYAVLAAATATEVVEHLNDQLEGITARISDAGGLVLVTDDAGPGVTVRVDQARSTAAWALGFGERGRSAEGAWSPALRWTAASDVTTVPAGRHRDCTAVAGVNGDVRLCWSTHDGSGWRLVDVRWVPRVLACTPSGLIEVALDTGGAPARVSGLPTDDVRHASVDAGGTTWLATSAGVVSRTVGGARPDLHQRVDVPRPAGRRRARRRDRPRGPAVVRDRLGDRQACARRDLDVVHDTTAAHSRRPACQRRPGGRRDSRRPRLGGHQRRGGRAS